MRIDDKSHGLDDTGKLGQKPIAYMFHDTPAVSNSLGLHQFFTQRLQTRKRPGFVGSHEAAVADNIGCQDGGQTAFLASFLRQRD